MGQSVHAIVLCDGKDCDASGVEGLVVENDDLMVLELCLVCLKKIVVEIEEKGVEDDDNNGDGSVVDTGGDNVEVRG